MEPWDGIEPYGDYLERIHRSPGAFQQGGQARPGFDIFGMPLPAAAGAAAAPAGGDTPPTGLTSAQRSAKAMIQDALGRWNLSSLGDKLWNQYLQGAPMEQVLGVNLRQEQDYKTRFAGMEALAKKGRAISEAQYLDLERTYAQMFRTYGLPPAMYDSPDDYAKLIAGEVAPTEIRDRLQLASAAATRAPQEVRDELSRLYGVDQGALTAFYLDPDKTLPVLTQQFQAGTLAATARRTGYGALSRTEAERLASLGITEDQAAKGFGELTRSAELMTALPGSGEDTIDRATGQAAVFEGRADAIERLNKRAEQRRAAFAGGGGFAAGREGISGLASAAS